MDGACTKVWFKDVSSLLKSEGRRFSVRRKCVIPGFVSSSFYHHFGVSLEKPICLRIEEEEKGEGPTLLLECMVNLSLPKSLENVFIQKKHMSEVPNGKRWFLERRLKKQDAVLWKMIVVTLKGGIFDEARLQIHHPGWRDVVRGLFRGKIFGCDEFVIVSMADYEVEMRVQCYGEKRDFGMVCSASTIRFQSLYNDCHVAECSCSALPSLMQDGQSRSFVLLLRESFSVESCLSMIERYCKDSRHQVMWYSDVQTLLRTEHSNPFNGTGQVLVLSGLEDAFASTDHAEQIPDLSMLLEWVLSRSDDSFVVCLSSKDSSTIHPQICSHFTEVLHCIKSVDSSLRKKTSKELPWEVMDEVVGHEEVKTALRKMVEAVIDRGECGSCLLIGSSGTGKSLFCDTLGKLVGQDRVYKGSIPSLINSYIGESERALSNMFQQARDNAPSVVIVDDMDMVFGSSKKKVRESRLFSQFMQELEKTKSGVAVLMTCKLSGMVDTSLVQSGRVEHVCFLNTPTKEERVIMTKKRLREIECVDALDKFDFDALSEHCVGFTGADVEKMMRLASLQCMLDGDDMIKLKHVEDAIQQLLQSQLLFN